MSKETIELGVLDKAPETKKPEAPNGYFGIRHIQVLLYFVLAIIAYGMRVNLSVGIVAMTEKTSLNPDVPIHTDWHDKSIVLSSFFWGYVLPQIGAGQLAKKFGPKWFLVGTMTTCSILSLLLPYMAELMGSKGVMASRALQGFCQGFIFPSIHNLLSHWVPISERSRLGSFVYAGGCLGTVISMIVTGIISASWYGWPMVFYLYGCLGLLWVFTMTLLGSNKPSESKRISKEERYYIEGGIPKDDSKVLSTPWKKIVTSLPVWALLVTHCGQNWGFWTLMTEIPSYMGHVMHFKITSNSYLSALPYFALWVLSFVFSAIADYLINKKVASIGTTRKICNSIGLVVPAIALVFLGFMDETHKNIAITLLVVAVGFNSAQYSGFNVNHMDISPNHSGTLMGITNCISNVFSLLAPLFVQVIVVDETNTSQWRTVFWISSIIYVASNTFFVFYGTGEVQEWNDESGTESTKDKYTGNAKEC